MYFFILHSVGGVSSQLSSLDEHEHLRALSTRHHLLSVTLRDLQDFLSYDNTAWIGRIVFLGAGNTLFLHSLVSLFASRLHALFLVFGLGPTFWSLHFWSLTFLRIAMVVWVCIYTVGSTISFFWLGSLHGRHLFCSRMYLSSLALLPYRRVIGSSTSS
jgi:hypothetical protein